LPTWRRGAGERGGGTAPGDERRLRGIPAAEHNCSSTMFDTNPLRALLANERWRTLPVRASP